MDWRCGSGGRTPAFQAPALCKALSSNPHTKLQIAEHICMLLGMIELKEKGNYVEESNNSNTNQDPVYKQGESVPSTPSVE
jgi:hypothetical protein